MEHIYLTYLSNVEHIYQVKDNFIIEKQISIIKEKKIFWKKVEKIIQQRQLFKLFPLLF